jgi:sterol desaturase/sphingolipid hydroxylase (fatty acid hydroxylase superfamily)
VRGGVFLTIWLLLRRPLASRKIRAEMPVTRQMFYTDVAEYGWPYFFASLLLMIVAQGAYFYWAHRLMHRSRWLWRLHATHHRSHNPTPCAAYSFDPGEAIIHAVFMPVFMALIPMHVVALFLFTAQ